MKKTYSLVSLIAATLLLVATSRLSADVVFTNFGPGMTFGNGGFILQGPDVHNIGDVDQAASFTTGPLSSLLTSVSLGIFVSSPANSPFDGRGPLDIIVAADAAGVPGAALDSTTVNVNNYLKQVITAPMGGSVQLAPNTKYWVIADTKTTFDGAWYWNSTNDFGPSAGRSGVGPWSLHAQPQENFSLQVEGRLVPEPATGLTLLLGGLMLAGFRRPTRMA